MCFFHKGETWGIEGYLDVMYIHIGTTRGFDGDVTWGFEKNSRPFGTQ